MVRDKQQINEQSGFTLIEVMVALFIFMIVMLGLAKGQLAALQTHTGNVYRDEALRIAEDELTRLKSLQFSLQGIDGELTPAAGWSPANIQVTANMRGTTVNFQRRIQVTDLGTTSTPMKQIDVAVGWSQGVNNGNVLAPTNMNNQTSVSTIIVRN